MKRVMIGAAFAALLAPPAAAGPLDADLWIGLPGGEDGFLLDERTGEAWMTGACLKPLAHAESTKGTWVSHTVELVSVGRSMTLLDQTFTLTVDGPTPSITVRNADRGGDQRFAAEVRRSCQQDAVCKALAETPAC